MANVKVGDVVQLKSGGPKMTVQTVEPNHIYCVWFAGTEHKGASFSADALEVVQPGVS